jgi:hypothetical protein
MPETFRSVLPFPQNALTIPSPPAHTVTLSEQSGGRQKKPDMRDLVGDCCPNLSAFHRCKAGHREFNA